MEIKNSIFPISLPVKPRLCQRKTHGAMTFCIGLISIFWIFLKPENSVFSLFQRAGNPAGNRPAAVIM